MKTEQEIRVAKTIEENNWRKRLCVMRELEKLKEYLAISIQRNGDKKSMIFK